MEDCTMKKLVCFLIIPLFLFSLYATDPTADAKVQLNLNTDKFNIGFASSEDNAKAFTSYSDPFVLTTNVADTTLVTTASGVFYLYYNAVIGSSYTYKMYLEIDSPLLHLNPDSETSYDDSEYIAYTIDVKKGDAVDWHWDGSSSGTISTGISIASPASSTASSVKNAIERIDLRGSSKLFNVSGYAKLTASVTSDISSKKKGSYESSIKLIVSTT